MQHFPIFMNLQARSVLIVGGGELAARKFRLIAKAGATVWLVAPCPNAELEAAETAGQLAILRRDFTPGDVQDKALVIGATADDGVDRAVSAAALAANVPVNIVDRPDLSTFITPAIVDRDPVVVAIGSSGGAPVLIRRLRAWIESHLPARYGRLAAFAASFRSAVAAAIGDGDGRRRFWERFFEGPIAQAILDGHESQAREQMISLINRKDPLAALGRQPDGTVYLVGAGPGDPDLLTFKALKCLQEADVIVTDKLVSPEVLELARRDADRIFVGKAKGDHTREQTEINAILAQHAAAGRKVVRLKGGDPFVFGRGGEEMAFLQAHGIRVEIVPGITAAAGCAAAAGIPLTHRDHAMAATLITGHGKDGEPDHDWADLARGRRTLVVYMGLSVAGRIVERLTAHGMSPETPAAVIENGTRKDQRVVFSCLRSLEREIAAHGLKAPALIVIGSVVALANHETETAGLPRQPATAAALAYAQAV